jgi:hydroxymethylpyrimidine/phosphomethylpyrimidine kinase
MTRRQNAAPPIALTIAGSDSGGGAGVQADLKTFHQFGVYGTSVITAITAQNTLGVRAIHAVPLHDVREQLDAVVEDLRPGAFKTGMLATDELVREIGRGIRAHELRGFVMDPVMVATSGQRLLAADAESAVREVLLPLSAVVTPNLEEAGILTGVPVTTVDEMAAAARALVRLGSGAALVKGGHLEDADGAAVVVDVLWDGATEHRWTRPRVDTRHTHGTGCTLSAAITAGLAHGLTVQRAVARATAFIGQAIATAPGLGAGHGPVNHFAPAHESD